MKHGDQLTGGELLRRSKEAAGEHLQSEVTGARRKSKSIKKLGRAFAVVPGKGCRELHVQQLKGGTYVHGGKITKPKGRAPHHKADNVLRRGTRNPRERVSGTVGRDQRI